MSVQPSINGQGNGNSSKKRWKGSEEEEKEVNKKQKEEEKRQQDIMSGIGVIIEMSGPCNVSGEPINNAKGGEKAPTICQFIRLKGDDLHVLLFATVRRPKQVQVTVDMHVNLAEMTARVLTVSPTHVNNGASVLDYRVEHKEVTDVKAHGQAVTRSVFTLTGTDDDRQRKITFSMVPVRLLK